MVGNFFSFSASADALNKGLPNIDKSVDLTVIDPLRQTDFTAGTYQWQSIRKRQRDKVRFRLEEAPRGMHLSSLGNLSWIPPKFADGRSYNVKIKAIIERYVDSKLEMNNYNFKVNVSKTEPLNFTVKESIIDIKGSDCNAGTGKKIDFSLILSKRDYSYYVDNYNAKKYYLYEDTGFIPPDLDKKALEEIPFRKIVSEVDYHVPKDIEVVSCFFTMGRVKFRYPEDSSNEPNDRRDYDNNYWVYAAVHKKQDEKLKLYRLSDSFRRVLDSSHQPPQRTQWWQTPSYYSRANGLFFVGREIEKN